MKSVIHEASSLARALEEGWKKAGKPHEFTVKIFQDAQTSFFGFIVKQKAKIGIFFGDQPAAEKADRSENRSYSRERSGQGQQGGRPRYNGNRGQGSRDGRSDNRSDRYSDRPRRDSRDNGPREAQREVKEKVEVQSQQPRSEQSHEVRAEKIDKKVINAFVKKD